MARVGPIYLESTNGTFSTPIWGNDVITPAGTYYTIALLDGQGNVVQCAQYQLTGSGTQDLSNLSPILTPAQLGGQLTAFFAGAPTYQTCSGTVNGVNTTFTFSAPASPTPTIALFVGGIYATPTTDYNAPTYQGSNTWQVVFQNTSIPQAGPISVVLFAQVGLGTRTVTSAPTVSVAGSSADNTIFCNFSAPTTITVPNAATAGISYELTFKDVSGNASTNNITLSCATGIEGGTTYVINTNRGAVTLRSDGTAWQAKSRF